MKILIWENRSKQGISLRQLAEMTGLSKSSINNYENNLVFPTILELEKIARALGIHITDLFDSEYK